MVKNKGNNIKIGLVDNYRLIRMAMSYMINHFNDIYICLEVDNNIELLRELDEGNIPDVILINLNTPEMYGYETVKLLKSNFPDIPIIIVCNNDSELIIIQLLLLGVQAFLRKNAHPDELKSAIESVLKTGYYYSNSTTRKLINLIYNKNKTTLDTQRYILNEKEVVFLKLAGTEFTYKEIANEMKLSPRTIDKLRDNLFVRFSIKNRVGLVLLALKAGLLNF